MAAALRTRADTFLPGSLAPLWEGLMGGLGGGEGIGGAAFLEDAQEFIGVGGITIFEFLSGKDNLCRQ